MKLFRDIRGASALEFGLVLPAITTFIIGIAQVGYLLWIDNLLHYSVDAAARCGAVGSTTYPCYGSGTANMTTTAKALFGMAVATVPAGTFAANTACTGSGLSGSYTVNVLLAKPVTVTAKSCYPTYS